jgi:hypothetical protein
MSNTTANCSLDVNYSEMFYNYLPRCMNDFLLVFSTENESKVPPLPMFEHLSLIVFKNLGSYETNLFDKSLKVTGYLSTIDISLCPT